MWLLAGHAGEAAYADQRIHDPMADLKALGNNTLRLLGERVGRAKEAALGAVGAQHGRHQLRAGAAVRPS